MINQEKLNKIFNKKNYLLFSLIILQFVAAIVGGVFSKDYWYVIAISLIGIVFNMLVSINNCYGFLFGVIYAVTNGVLAYFTKIYATFGFMIIMQAPMAIYSFISWKKNAGKNGTELKPMKWWQAIISAAAMALLGVASYFLLKVLKSNNLIFDTVFFVFSVSACLLLAFRYKASYIVTLLSGVGGTVLYSMQAVTIGSGVSIAIFYGIVTLNSVIAIIKNYKKKNKLNNIVKKK